MRLSGIDLNLLRALDALLSENNVTRAARKTFVTQQAMSSSLRRLREHFGDELLVRVGRGLELTPLGSALAQPMRELMLQVERTLSVQPLFDPASSDRHFRIAMSDYASMTLLPHLVRLLAAIAPHVLCEVRPMHAHVLRDLEQGDLDLCLLPTNWRDYQSSMPEHLRTLRLFCDDFVCAVDADHPDIADALTLDCYRTLPHGLVRFGGALRSLVEQSWDSAGLDLHVAATATSFTSLLFMIPGTRLVATAQRKLATLLLPLLPIRVFECPLPMETLHETLAWHDRNEGDHAHLFMRQMFSAAAADLGGNHKPQLLVRSTKSIFPDLD